MPPKNKPNKSNAAEFCTADSIISSANKKGSDEELDHVTEPSSSSNNCYVCNTEVKNEDHALACCCCDFWHHIKCVGVSESAYSFLNKHSHQHGVKWYCTKCNKSVSKLFDLVGAVTMQQAKTDKKINKLSTEVTSAKKHIQELDKTVTKLDSKVQKLDISSQAQASELQNKVDNVITKQISETQSGQYVADSRSNNLR